MANNTTMGFDELFAIGDVENFLAKAKEKTAKKLAGKTFAGMEKDDVVQEVLIKIHRSMGKFDSDVARASTFVDHVIDNMIKDMYRKCMTEKNLVVVNAAELVTTYNEEEEEYGSLTGSRQIGEIDVEFENVELITDIMENLGLNDREKEIFRLRSEGYEFVEIADHLGVSKARISQIWSSIRKKYENM